MTQCGVVVAFDRLVLATAHLKAKPGYEGTRALQLAQLEAHAAKLGAAVVPGFSAAETPMVVAGDFNDALRPTFNGELCLNTPVYASAYETALPACRDAAPPYTTWKVRAPYAGNEHTPGEVRRTIDHVLVRGAHARALAVWMPPADADVPACRLPCERYPSDHVALAVRLALGA